jgi:uncharacterized protein DUF1648
MMRGGRLFFILLALAGVGFVALTLPHLPPQMAIHFNLHGAADNWASRGVYVTVLVLIGLVLPLGIVALVPWLGATKPDALNVPGRDYWFAPERRPEGVRRLAEQMWWLASLLLALAILLHGLILDAHSATPPRLPLKSFLGMLVGFLLILVLWSRRLKAVMRPPG